MRLAGKVAVVRDTVSATEAVRQWAEAYVDFAAGEKRSWLHGQVESLCGKSFAHISRRQFIRFAVLNATQSSWNVV